MFSDPELAPAYGPNAALMKFYDAIRATGVH
jgi:hypothetical protein